MSNADVETLQLLRDWHAGDRSALGSLVARNLDWIRTYVRRKLDQRLRGKFDSLDMVQDAMVQMLEQGPRFVVRSEEHFRALLARIVLNDLSDRQRWIGRERRDVARERPIGSDSILYLDPPAREPQTTPSQHLVRDERREWVRLAIEFLSPEDREVLRMRVLDGRPFRDVAAALGIAEDAARMRCKRAFGRLGEKVIELREGRLGRVLGEGDLL